jgi:hypothetical protein
MTSEQKKLFIANNLEKYWKIPLYDIDTQKEFLSKMVDDYKCLVALDEVVFSNIHNENK